MDVMMVGAGAIARDYLAALDTTPELALCGAVDVSEPARRTFAERTGLPAFASLRDALAADAGKRAAAALVLAPPAAHEDLTVHLLAAGKHVFCEKPLATSTSAANRMLGMAHRQERVLLMASKFRYVPDVIEAHAMLKDGLIGDVVFYENSFCRPIDMGRRWNADPQVSGGGVLIDNGTHSIDLARYFLGPIVRILAQFGRRMQDVPVEDSVRIQFEAGAGCSGSIELSWSVDNGREHYVSLCGSRGTLQVGWRRSRYRLHGQEQWTEFGTGYDKVATFARQLQDFAWAVRGDHDPLVRPDDMIESVRVIEAAYRAARVERWIPVQGYHGDFV
jgi:predicted dehydrogenase